MTLDDHEQDRHRQGHHDCGRHHQTPIDVYPLEKVHDADGQGLLGHRVYEDPGEQIVVPRYDYGENRRGDDARHRRGQDYLVEHLKPARAVDHL